MTEQITREDVELAQSYLIELHPEQLYEATIHARGSVVHLFEIDGVKGGTVSTARITPGDSLRAPLQIALNDCDDPIECTNLERLIRVADALTEFANKNPECCIDNGKLSL